MYHIYQEIKTWFDKQLRQNTGACANNLAILLLDKHWCIHNKNDWSHKRTCTVIRRKPWRQIICLYDSDCLIFPIQILTGVDYRLISQRMDQQRKINDAAVYSWLRRVSEYNYAKLDRLVLDKKK